MKRFLLMIIGLLIIPLVYAEEVSVYYHVEGGTITTSGFTVQDGFVYSSDGNYYSTYDINATVNDLSNMNGKKFELIKTNYVLESGKEWFAYDTNGNKHYYANNKQYNLSSIVLN